MTAQWADFPPYGGLRNTFDGDTGPSTAIGITAASGDLLPSFPVPNRWRKLYPGPKLFDSAFLSDSRFVTELSDLTTQLALLSQGGNADPAWHPAFMFFNTGPQFPSWQYNEPAGVYGTVFHEIDERWRGYLAHRWAEPKHGAARNNTGINILGNRSDVWNTSLRVRTRCFTAHREHNTYSSTIGLRSQWPMRWPISAGGRTSRASWWTLARAPTRTPRWSATTPLLGRRCASLGLASDHSLTAASDESATRASRERRHLASINSTPTSQGLSSRTRKSRPTRWTSP
jgi:hypothetical protein